MVYSSFYIKSKDLDVVKSKIRSLSSFRFKSNPLFIGDKVNICIEGDVKDTNELDKFLETLKETPKKEPKKGLFYWLRRKK